MCELSADVVQATNRLCAGKVRTVQARRVAELVVDDVCGWRVRLLDSIHLRFLGIGILFGVNLRCVHI